MAADIPTTEPTTIIAGDTLAWTKEVDDYSPATWTLTYYLRGPGGAFTIAATGSTTFAVSIAAAVTATYVPGDYKLYGFVTSGAERYKVHESDVTVLPNVAAQTSPIEIRTLAKQILDAHMLAYKNRAGRPEQSYSIQAAGRSYNYKTDSDMIEAIKFWQAEVAGEEAEGSATKRNILVRFN